MYFLLTWFFAQGHAGHVHENLAGCAGSIFAGPTIRDYAYFIDWNTEVVFTARIGVWEIESRWQLPFEYPGKANYALTESPDGVHALLFHYEHAEPHGGQLKYAVLRMEMIILQQKMWE